MASWLQDKALFYWPLALVAAAGLVLLLANLSGEGLWADEGDTAVLASNIVKFGLPKAWDGVTFIDSDFGARENDHLVMVSSPWLQYYAAAASFLAIGENTFAARFPFALAGWITLLLIYRLVWQTTADRRAATCATLLTVCSLQFLLFSRQSRYYPLAMLLTCLLVELFLRMKSARQSAFFAAVAILLFHTHPIGIIAVVALGLLTLIYPRITPQPRYFWFSLPVIAALSLPWFAIASSGYSENALPVPRVGDFFARLIQYVIESAAVTPLFGIVILAVIIVLREHRNKDANSNPLRRAFPEDRGTQLLLIISVIFVLYALAMAVSQKTGALWVTGIRYTSAIIPLFAIAAGILIVKVSRGKQSVFVPLILVFACTNLPEITPWMFWADKTANPQKKFVAVHLPTRSIDRFLPTGDLLFVRDLFRPNPGTVSKSCEFLRQYAQAQDLIVTNYESEPLYFCTRLPQAMKITKEDPIYETARRRGLPEYVFGVGRVRWIVWRFNWDDYLGITWSDVKRVLSEEGAAVVEVASLKETAWENRENIHFHRFAGDIYLFPQDESMPPARIFRVDWSNTP